MGMSATKLSAVKLSAGKLSAQPLGASTGTPVPSGYSVSWDAASYLTTESAASFTMADAEVGATLAYTVSSSGGGTPVSDSLVVASADEQVTGIDLTGLNPGTITVSVTLTNDTGTGDPATDDAALEFTVLSVFSGGIQGIWGDLQDAGTRFQDAAGTTPATDAMHPVGRISDKSGNGNHATQSVSGSRPALGIDNGLYYIVGDGVDDYLRATFTISQPWWRMCVARQVTWTQDDLVFGGVTTVAGRLRQSFTTPQLRLSSGASDILNGDLPVGEDGIILEIHNGANSSLQINDNAPVTGNAGTDVPGGITIFASNSGTLFGNFRVYELVMAAGVPTEQQIANMLAYFQAKYADILP